jgi:hypothetical protein
MDVPSEVVFVPVDFERQAFADELRDTGLDWGKPVIVSWIGVTMYLTLSAVEQTLATLAEFAGGSQVVISYDLPATALRVCNSKSETHWRPLFPSLESRSGRPSSPTRPKRSFAAWGSTLSRTSAQLTRFATTSAE